ncbi:MAG: M15 family metallopeptidase [Lachnospiraceae bacterium]|nr:M15 family metallopeptidase [Lachnospiraceae bacterium]
MWKEKLINYGKEHPKATYAIICILALIVFCENIKKKFFAKHRKRVYKRDEITEVKMEKGKKEKSQYTYAYVRNVDYDQEKVMEQFRSMNHAAWVPVVMICIVAVGIVAATASMKEPKKVIAQTRNLLDERVVKADIDTDAMISPTVTEKPKKVAVDNAKLPWNLILINDEHEVPEDYQVNLVSVNGYQVDERIEESLRQMLEAAKKAGMGCKICSAYRTPQKQQKLVDKDVAKYKAKGYSAQEALELTYLGVSPVNHSEHQTGLTVDIVSTSHQSLDPAHADTKEAIWLKEHCHEYGFIVRYMEGKEEITHRKAESWHFRYVGVEAATEIMQNNLALEEYLEEYLE